MTTDTPHDPDVEPAAPPAPAEAAPEPTAVVDHTPEPLAELEETTPVSERPAASEEVAPADEEPGKPKSAEDDKPAEKPRNPNLRWYVVKVQSGREDSIREAIERRVKIEGVEDYFGQVVVPVEREVIVIQTGKRKGQKQIRKKKKFPGYVMAEVEYNDVFCICSETSGWALRRRQPDRAPANVGPRSPGDAQ